MSEIAKKTGVRIRTLRTQRGLTQEQLAFEADIHPAYIGQIERGEKSPTLDTLEKIVNALHVEFADLFQASQAGFTDLDVGVAAFLKDLSSAEQNDLRTIVLIMKKWKQKL